MTNTNETEAWEQGVLLLHVMLKELNESIKVKVLKNGSQRHEVRLSVLTLKTATKRKRKGRGARSVCVRVCLSVCLCLSV